MSADKDLARRAAQESIVLLRNQNNVLPLSSSVRKLVVTGPSADNVSSQLGGWSVSWQGVFGTTQPCCVGPANQIPPAVTVLKGIQAAAGASTQVIAAPDQAVGRQRARLRRRRGRRGRREVLRRGSRRPAAATTRRRPAGADPRAPGHRQAGDRRGAGGTAARPWAGRERERAADGLAGRDRDGQRRRRHPLRQGEPERPALGHLAVGLGRRVANRLQSRRPITGRRTGRSSTTSFRATTAAWARATTRRSASASGCRTRRSRSATSPHPRPSGRETT